ncbi:MAG: diphthine--ammonia ligase [Spirochaetota bacterium]
MDTVAISWAGGKDSSLACHRAMQAGYKVSCLINFITLDAKASMTHGLSSELLRTQSSAMGIPIIQKRTTWINYEQTLKNTMNELKEEGIQGMVFGEIDLKPHKDWIEKICRDIGFIPVLPLWGSRPDEILSELVEEGFKMVVVSAREGHPGWEWLGEEINRESIKKLHSLRDKFGLHMCGENGEYHTFVLDGPIFKTRINILKTNKEIKQGQWFLKIEKHSIKSKT